jgi:hypothetical protein
LTPINLVGYGIELIVLGIILGIFVWLAGKALGAPKATYYHGILTVVSAIILRDIIGYFLLGWIAKIAELLVVLLLIRYFFAAGWLRAIVIAILALVIGIIITLVLIAILSLIGFTFLSSTLKGLGSEHTTQPTCHYRCHH